MENLAGGVKRVSLNVSALGGHEVTIDFALLGDDDGLESTLDLDNIVVAQSNVVPEPTSLAIWILVGAATLPCRRHRRLRKIGRNAAKCFRVDLLSQHAL